jgi:hypothetical protein
LDGALNLLAEIMPNLLANASIQTVVFIELFPFEKSVFLTGPISSANRKLMLTTQTKIMPLFPERKVNALIFNIIWDFRLSTKVYLLQGIKVTASLSLVDFELYDIF